MWSSFKNQKQWKPISKPIPWTFYNGFRPNRTSWDIISSAHSSMRVPVDLHSHTMFSCLVSNQVITHGVIWCFGFLCDDLTLQQKVMWPLYRTCEYEESSCDSGPFFFGLYSQWTNKRGMTCHAMSEGWITSFESSTDYKFIPLGHSRVHQSWIVVLELLQASFQSALR